VRKANFTQFDNSHLLNPIGFIFQWLIVEVTVQAGMDQAEGVVVVVVMDLDLEE
jgi:hypothetical protein